MTGRNEWDVQPAQHGQVQPVDVKVNHIELGGALRNRLEQRCLGGHGVRTWPFKSKGARPRRDKSCASGRIAGGKQRYIVA